LRHAVLNFFDKNFFRYFFFIKISRRDFLQKKCFLIFSDVILKIFCVEVQVGLEFSFERFFFFAGKKFFEIIFFEKFSSRKKKLTKCF